MSESISHSSREFAQSSRNNASHSESSWRSDINSKDFVWNVVLRFDYLHVDVGNADALINLEQTEISRAILEFIRPERHLNWRISKGWGGLGIPDRERFISYPLLHISRAYFLSYKCVVKICAFILPKFISIVSYMYFLEHIKFL